MKVAIVGTGAVARYLVDELLLQSHEIIAVSRSKKAFLDDLRVPQHKVQYTAAELAPALRGCDAVICTVSSSSPDLVPIHEALLEACKSAPSIKRFVPSIWIGNFEDVRDQPYYGADRIQQICDMLKSQKAVEWTVLSVGWLIDYVLPAHQRYLPNGDEFWVQNVADKTFKLYGSGTQVISCTSARDAARSVVRLLETDTEWEDFTYISGEQISWAELWDIVKEDDPEYRIITKSLTESIRGLFESENEMDKVAAVFDVMGHSEALRYPQSRVVRHREMYFQGLRYRTVRELIADAKKNPDKVV
ncbi:hypothetical protein ACJ41O_014918 [Fusarium nematophilum]